MIVLSGASDVQHNSDVKIDIYLTNKKSEIIKIYNELNAEIKVYIELFSDRIQIKAQHEEFKIFPTESYFRAAFKLKFSKKNFCWYIVIKIHFISSYYISNTNIYYILILCKTKLCILFTQFIINTWPGNKMNFKFYFSSIHILNHCDDKQ